MSSMIEKTVGTALTTVTRSSATQDQNRWELNFRATTTDPPTPTALITETNSAAGGRVVRGPLGVLVEADDPLQAGELPADLLDLRGALRVCHDDGRFRVADDVRNLGRLEVGVHGPRDGARLPRAEVGDQGRGGVGGEKWR